MLLTVHVDANPPNDQGISNRHDRIAGKPLPQPRRFFGTWRDRNGAMDGDPMLKQSAPKPVELCHILLSNPCWDTAAFGERVEQGN